jgi:CRP-like cAMP-binding protein
MVAAQISPDPARFTALRAVRELSSRSDRDIRSLLHYVDEVHVGAGETVARKGTLATEFIVVIDGALRNGSTVLGSGSSFGWKAMWERSENCATVTAEVETRLLVMSHEQFRAVKALGDYAAGTNTIPVAFPKPMAMGVVKPVAGFTTPTKLSMPESFGDCV